MVGRHARKHKHCGFSDDEDDHTPVRSPCSSPQQQAPRSPPSNQQQQQSQAHAGCHVGVDLTPQQIAAATTGKRTKVIGVGGFGKVYASDLPPLGRVAIKVASLNGERALAREAIHLRRCAHPAIVRALGSCWAPGCSAVALEHLSGGCLDDRIADPHVGQPAAAAGKGHRAQLDWRQRLRVAYQVASALDYLHRTAHVVHCDIKPGNVLLDAEGNATLIDFGIARPTNTDQHAVAHTAAAPASNATKHGSRTSGSGGSSSSSVGTGAAAMHLRALAAGVASGGVAQMHGWCGTRDWLDPLFEQLGQLCEKSDVYSLGVIMVQLLFDSVEPREARRVAMHQVKSGEMHLPANLQDWPRDSALAFGSLALRCCNAGDRDARATAEELTAELLKLLIAAGEAGTSSLQAGTLKLCAFPKACSSSATPALRGGAAHAAALPGRLCPAAGAAAVAKAVELQLELLPGGALKGTATLQLPLPPLQVINGAVAPQSSDPGPGPQRVAVSGEWVEASGRIHLTAAAAAATGATAGGVRSGSGAAAGAAPCWPVEFEGCYSGGKLEGSWTYRPAQQQGQKVAAAPLKAASTYWFVAFEAAAIQASSSATQAAAAAALAEGLAAAVADMSVGSSSRSRSSSKRCSRNALVERAASLVRAM